MLYSFGFDPDGNFPTAPVLRDPRGNLYGTTQIGGLAGFGTVYKVSPSGSELILHEFTGNPDGASPVAGLSRDTQGILYGTTAGGGANNQGTVYNFEIATGILTVLHNFGENSSDGVKPFGGVVLDGAGNIYGTTYNGGLSGCGTVFKLDSAGQLTNLHSFSCGSDGQFPTAGLFLGPSGSLFGTTIEGGIYGGGVVFQLKP
ncbi:MAG: hypothetical protein H0X25_17495 [Acidobacteriales bacterium]|nr:hypothetical protein [Terriglobales bacterium]